MKKVIATFGVILLLLAWSSTANAFYFTSYLIPGSRGTEVVQLQEFLRAQGLFTYPTSTGFYGPITTASVTAFQVAHGIQPVGMVGPITRQKLNGLIIVPTTTSTITTPTPPRRRSSVHHSSNNNTPDPVAPSDITLSAMTVPEDAVASTTIGTLGAIADHAVTFSIASDPDAKFAVDGSSLVLAGALDFEASTSHSVTIRATDQENNLMYDEVFVITVTDVSEIPAWLPQAPSGDYPLAYADFKDGHYWIDGAEVTADDVLVSTARIVPGTGYVQENEDTGVRFDDGFISPFIGGDWTLVSEWTVSLPQEVVTHNVWAVNHPDENIDTATFVDASGVPTTVTAFTTGGGYVSTGATNAAIGLAKGAVSRTDTSMVISVNGEANQSASTAAAGTDPDKVILGSYDTVSTDVSDFSVQTFAVYELQDAADLPELSDQ